MSIKVAIDELAEVVAKRSPAAYVCTTGSDGRAHLAHLRIELMSGTLRCAAGRTARANVADQPLVVVLWPGPEDDYSLIVDGEAAVEGEGLAITPTGAVLHRPADTE